MRLSRRAWSLVVLAALVLPTLGCSGDDGRGSEWRRIGEIDRLLADDLPDGWVVSTAILRPGRPTSEWTDRADVFVDADREAVFVVTASEFTPPAGAGEIGPGPPPGDAVDAEVDELVYVLAFAGVAAADDAKARQIRWRSESVSLAVVRIAAGPADDALLGEVADELADSNNLDFENPKAVTEAGFTLAGTITDLEDAADYTIVWTHEDDAGGTRDEVRDAREGAPRLSVNVGARMYAPVVAAGADLTDDPRKAEVHDDGGSLELRFLRDGLPVRVGGSGVEPEALRALALSLREVSFDEWSETLGDRLLTDEPEER